MNVYVMFLKALSVSAAVADLTKFGLFSVCLPEIISQQKASVNWDEEVEVLGGGVNVTGSTSKQKERERQEENSCQLALFITILAIENGYFVVHKNLVGT